MEKNTFLFVLIAFALGVLITLIFVNQTTPQKSIQENITSVENKNISNVTEKDDEERITGKTFSELKKMNKKIVCDVDDQVKLYIWGDRFRSESMDESCGTYTTVYKQMAVYAQCENELRNATECDWMMIETQTDSGIEKQFDNVEPELFDCAQREFDVSVFDTLGKVCSRQDIQKE
ncbi:MAG: hypothetical protein ABID61_03565 [Candidatus Micrarchaeota archaeon]